MPYDEKYYLKIKNEAEESLFQIPGVYGVALGPKVVGGELTREFAIQVYVRDKLPKALIPPNERIPREIEGIKTDVLKGGGVALAVGATARTCPSGKIKNATSATPVVITTEKPHGLADGDLVAIAGVSNVGRIAVTIQIATGDDNRTFRLPGVDRAGEPAYIDGGTWSKVCTATCPTGKIKSATTTDPTVITTEMPHGLADGDLVAIAGVSNSGRVAVNIQIVAGDDDRTFRLPGVDRSIEAPYTDGGTWYKVCTPNSLCCCPGGGITDAINTNPVKISTPAPHHLQSGDEVRIDQIKDMFQIRNGVFTVGKIEDQDTFEMKVNGTTYRSGTQESGSWSKLCIAPVGMITGATETNPVRVTSPAHRLIEGDKVYIFAVAGMGGLNNFRSSQPYVVKPTASDGTNVFELTGVDGANFGTYLTGGFWVRIREDRRKYSRVLGGIRIAMQEENVTVQDALIFDVPVIHQPDLDGGVIPTAVRDLFDTLAYGLSQSVTVDVMVPNKRWEINDRERKRVYIVLLENGRLNFYGRGRDQGHTGTKVDNAPRRVFKREKLTYGTLGCLARDASGTTVMLSNFHVLWSTGESNIHHPAYSKCKSQKIGERLRFAPHGESPSAPGLVDAAIGNLKKPDKADPWIVDIGPVRGAVGITTADIRITDEITRGYRVRKRGVTTLLTEGLVVGLNATFNDAETRVFLRDQMLIRPMPGESRAAFCAPGDSGSAVVNDNNEVVGLLLGVDGFGNGIASPILQVQTLLGITVCVAPQTSGTPGSSNGNEPSEPLRVATGYPELLTEVVGEALGSEAGAQFVALVQRHHREVQDLIHHNKRVAATWRRYEGPAFLEELHHFVDVRDEPLPKLINGKPLMDCLEKILWAFKEFGSPRLAADAAEHGPGILQLINLSYSEILRTVKAQTVTEAIV